MNEDLKMLPEDLPLTKGYEKCRLQAYNDEPQNPSKGKWTIAWGATHHKDGTPVKEGDIITQAQADDLLLYLMAKEAEPKVKERIHIGLTKQQYVALCDFAYNASSGYDDASGKYHDWDLWHNINQGMTNGDLINYWTNCGVYGGGVKLAGLVRRRKSEVNLFLTGKINFFE